MTQAKKQMLTRVSPTLYETFRASAHAEGYTTSDYLALAAAHFLTGRKDHVALARARQEEEIERLSGAARDLIELSHRADEGR